MPNHAAGRGPRRFLSPGSRLRFRLPTGRCRRDEPRHATLPRFELATLLEWDGLHTAAPSLGSSSLRCDICHHRGDLCVAMRRTLLLSEGNQRNAFNGWSVRQTMSCIWVKSGANLRRAGSACARQNSGVRPRPAVQSVRPRSCGFALRQLTNLFANAHTNGSGGVKLGRN